MFQLRWLLITLIGIGIGGISCADAQTKSTAASQGNTTLLPDSMTDARDGEVYATISIGEQIWMAENLRYTMPGSMLNPDNPSPSYGRLYILIAAQSACPEGWHLPSDREWDILEMAHGMPDSFINKGGWRGKHAIHLKSTTAWDDDGGGTDSLGFHVLPAGYYFSEKITRDVAGLQGLGYSAAFWSAMEDSVAYARFMFGPRAFVNKWADERNETGAALSCRCVKD